MKIQETFRQTTDSSLVKRNSKENTINSENNKYKKEKKKNWYDTECKNVKHRIKLPVRRKHPLNDEERKRRTQKYS